MIATIPMVKRAQWHTQPFQKGFLHQSNTSSKKQRIFLTPTMKVSLLWWLQGKNLHNCHSIILITWVTITSDASNRGWGAHCLMEVAQGRWNFPSLGIIFNILELRAAFQALLSFRHLIMNSSIMLRLDNTTAVACKEAGRNSQLVPASGGGANNELGSEELVQHLCGIHSGDSECTSSLVFT